MKTITLVTKKKNQGKKKVITKEEKIKGKKLSQHIGG